MLNVKTILAKGSDIGLLDSLEIANSPQESCGFTDGLMVALYVARGRQARKNVDWRFNVARLNPKTQLKFIVN